MVVMEEGFRFVLNKQVYAFFIGMEVWIVVDVYCYIMIETVNHLHIHAVYTEDHEWRRKTLSFDQVQVAIAMQAGDY